MTESSMPNSGAYRSHPAPHEITADLLSRPPLQAAEIGRQFKGLRVHWQLALREITRRGIDNDGAYVMMLNDEGPPGFTLVKCLLVGSPPPELRITPRNSLIEVRGVIVSAEPHIITMQVEALIVGAIIRDVDGNEPEGAQRPTAVSMPLESGASERRENDALTPERIRRTPLESAKDHWILWIPALLFAAFVGGWEVSDKTRVQPFKEEIERLERENQRIEKQLTTCRVPIPSQLRRQTGGQ